MASTNSDRERHDSEQLEVLTTFLRNAGIAYSLVPERVYEIQQASIVQYLEETVYAATTCEHERFSQKTALLANLITDGVIQPEVATRFDQHLHCTPLETYLKEAASLFSHNQVLLRAARQRGIARSVRGGENEDFRVMHRLSTLVAQDLISQEEADQVIKKWLGMREEEGEEAEEESDDDEEEEGEAEEESDDDDDHDEVGDSQTTATASLTDSEENNGNDRGPDSSDSDDDCGRKELPHHISEPGRQT